MLPVLGKVELIKDERSQDFVFQEQEILGIERGQCKP